MAPVFLQLPPFTLLWWGKNNFLYTATLQQTSNLVACITEFLRCHSLRKMGCKPCQIKDTILLPHGNTNHMTLKYGKNKKFNKIM